MTDLKFVVNGRTVAADQLISAAPKAPPRVSTALKTVENRCEAKQGLGFVVLGYSPAHWDELAFDHEAAFKRWANDEFDAKHPGSLAEFTPQWMRKHKAKKVRSKPYALMSAAKECAQLADQAGWQFVRIEEIMKG